MNNDYDFGNNLHTDVRALIPLIAVHGDNLVGAEIGVWKGDAFLTMLHNCPNIKTLHGVDFYEPYNDYLSPGVYNANEPSVVYDKKDIDFIKLVCYHRLEYSGHKDKIRFHEMDSNEAAEYIDDDSLDFIFLDAYLTGEQAKNDLEVWLRLGMKRLKPGGEISLIMKASSLGTILSTMEEKVGSIKILPISSFKNVPCSRIIVTGKLGAKGDTSLLTPLIMHTKKNFEGKKSNFTKLAEGILYEGDSIDLGTI